MRVEDNTNAARTEINALLHSVQVSAEAFL